MKRLLLAALIALPALMHSGAAQAQYSDYNPYRSLYNNWNRSQPGYNSYGKEYRRQIREMNPYGDAYRQHQRQNRELNGGGGW